MKSIFLLSGCLFLFVGCSLGNTVSNPNSPQPTKRKTSTATRPPPSRTATPTLTPSQTPSPTPDCRGLTGEVITTSYPGVVVKEPIPLRIYLPPCYDLENREYPSLYLLHGFPFDETQWEELGTIEKVEEGISEGHWNPMVILMPRLPEPLFTGTDGGPGSYEEELVEGLVPRIEASFRVGSAPEDRAVAGISRGGVWAFEIGFRNPEVFDIVAALSPALAVNSARPPYDPFNLIRERTFLPEHIFLSVGESEGGFRTSVEELIQLMDEYGVEYEFFLTEGAHDESTWKGVLEDLLEFIVGSLAEE